MDWGLRRIVVAQVARARKVTSGLLSHLRYAITVWYFDAKERAAAKDKYQLGNQPPEPC